MAVVNSSSSESGDKRQQAKAAAERPPSGPEPKLSEKQERLLNLEDETAHTTGKERAATDEEVEETAEDGKK